MRERPGANISDNRKAVWPVDPVNPHYITPANNRTNKGYKGVGRVAMERNVHHSAEADDGLRQTAGENRNLTCVRIYARDDAIQASGNEKITPRTNGGTVGVGKLCDQLRETGRLGAVPCAC